VVYMLVSKIKPCTCEFKRLNGETADGSLVRFNPHERDLPLEGYLF